MSEDEICAGWHGSGRGYALKAAETILGGRYLSLDPDDPGNYDWIHMELQRARWFLVEVSAGKLADIVLALASPPSSQFGPVSPHSLYRHVVVLVGAVDANFHFLDPYYPAAGQPLSMTREEFARAFTGRLVEVPLG
jgi:hypothetical protein